MRGTTRPDCERLFRTGKVHTQTWLVVSRIGPDGEELRISDTGVAALPDAPAPDVLNPRHTLIGIGRSVEHNLDKTPFKLQNLLYPGQSCIGRFVPAQGEVSVIKKGGLICLDGTGCFLLPEARKILPTTIKIQLEAPGRWTIDAIQCPWTHEVMLD